MSASRKTGKPPSIELEYTLPERRKHVRDGSAAVPRLARLLALAIRLQELLDRGEATSYQALEQVAGVSRSRVSQVMSLLGLAPDIQESILCLRKQPPRENKIRKIAREPDWVTQRQLWHALTEAHAGRDR